MKSRMLVLLGVVALLSVNASRVMAQSKTKADADAAKTLALNALTAADNAYGEQKSRWGSDDGKQKNLVKSLTANSMFLTKEQIAQASAYLNEAQGYLDDANSWLSDAKSQMDSGTTAYNAGNTCYYKNDFNGACSAYDTAENDYVVSENCTSFAAIALSNAEAAQKNAAEIIYWGM